MSVYLIRAGGEGPVKIGHARDPLARLSELQTAHHEPLALLRIWPGGAEAEAALHRVFGAHRIRGEWFRFSPLMLVDDINPFIEMDLRQALPGVVRSAVSGVFREQRLELRRLRKRASELARRADELSALGSDHAALFRAEASATLAHADALEAWGLSRSAA